MFKSLLFKCNLHKEHVDVLQREDSKHKYQSSYEEINISFVYWGPISTSMSTGYSSWGPIHTVKRTYTH